MEARIQGIKKIYRRWRTSPITIKNNSERIITTNSKFKYKNTYKYARVSEKRKETTSLWVETNEKKYVKVKREADNGLVIMKLEKINEVKIDRRRRKLNQKIKSFKLRKEKQ